MSGIPILQCQSDKTKLKQYKMKRTAKAHWVGTIKEGKGELTTQSEILNRSNYSFKTRFTGEEKGTNPEELLAAAHAGCFTMAVSLALTGKGLNPTSLDTEAILSMDATGITAIHLSITGNVPGISAAEFEGVTKEAEKNCLISKVLNLPISSESHFVSGS
jgi:lipoyl-dependent peroxiredoxin